jgi:Ca-activated chloride channel family protein
MKKLMLTAALALTGLSLWAAEITVTADPVSPVLPAGQKQTTWLKVGLKGFDWDTGAKPAPLNVALVLDRSGSMEGEKLDRAKQAAQLALTKLSDRDILSIITFESEVQVLLPATRVTDKRAISRLIDSIDSAGSTALFGGVSKGAAEVRKFLNKNSVNRVILMSDGIANVGPDSPAALGDLGASLRQEGISVSTIGLGLDYNEDLMTRLAQTSDGNHAFVQEPQDLAKIFDLEFRDALAAVARDVKITVSFSGGVVPLRVLNRPGQLSGTSVSLDLAQLASGQEKYFLVEVEVPALAAGKSLDLASVKASYGNLATGKAGSQSVKATVSASSDLAVVKKSVKPDVLEAVGVQQAVEASRNAVDLRDKGDAQGAQKVLEESSQDLQELNRSLPAPSAAVNAAAEKAKQDASAIVDDSKDYNQLRKTMRADQYQGANQQSY